MVYGDTSYGICGHMVDIRVYIWVYIGYTTTRITIYFTSTAMIDMAMRCTPMRYGHEMIYIWPYLMRVGGMWVGGEEL